jgi:iron complex outermembrane receptor protein
MDSQMCAPTAATVADEFDAMVTVEDKHWAGYRHHTETDRQSVYANTGWQLSDALEKPCVPYLREQ